MTKRFRVRWTHQAETDLMLIIRFIAADSPARAAKVYKRIRLYAATLNTFPERGHVLPELVELDIVGYRELSVPPFRIIYRTEKKTVFVLAILDGRRDIKQILSERLLRL